MAAELVLERYMCLGQALDTLHREGNYVVDDGLFPYPPDEFAKQFPPVALTAPAILRLQTDTGEGTLLVYRDQDPATTGQSGDPHYASHSDNGEKQFSGPTPTYTQGAANDTVPLPGSSALWEHTHWELNPSWAELYHIHPAALYFNGFF